MNIQNNIGKYLLGAVAGVALVVGCGGGGGGGVNSAAAASTTGVTAQLLCTGGLDYLTTLATAGTPQIVCQSSASPTQQKFNNFYEITQQGWIMAQANSLAGGLNSYLFYK